jgi:hypothetical protein
MIAESLSSLVASTEQLESSSFDWGVAGGIVGLLVFISIPAVCIVLLIAGARSIQWFERNPVKINSRVEWYGKKVLGPFIGGAITFAVVAYFARLYFGDDGPRFFHDPDNFRRMTGPFGIFMGGSFAVYEALKKDRKEAVEKAREEGRKEGRDEARKDSANKGTAESK